MSKHVPAITNPRVVANWYRVTLNDGTQFEFLDTCGFSGFELALTNDESIQLGDRRVPCEDVTEIIKLGYESDFRKGVPDPLYKSPALYQMDATEVARLRRRVMES
jgi:hypothetical protein